MPLGEISGSRKFAVILVTVAAGCASGSGERSGQTVPESSMGDDLPADTAATSQEEVSRQPTSSRADGEVSSEPPAAEACPTVAQNLEEFLARNQGRDGRTQDAALRVHSVAEEYQYLASVPCGSGEGTWQVLRQGLVRANEGGPFDALEVRCSDGSGEAVIYFDVSSFFGRPECYE